MLNDEKEINDSIDTNGAPTPYEAEERSQEEAMDEALSESIAEDEAKIAAAENSGASPAEVHTLKKKAVNSAFWKISETFARYGVGFIVSVVLARLILPESFGAVAMLTIFTAVCGVFIDSGFGGALIRKNDRTQTDCCTVFYFNIAIAIFLYIVLFFCAPLIARFYDMPVLTKVLRITAITMIISSTGAVHSGLLTANLQFNILAKYGVAAQIISGIVGITLAYFDWQIWALVTQQLVSSTLNTIFIWWKSPWRPQLIFCFKSLKELFGFGSKMLASALLDTVYTNMYGIVIGKVYRAKDLAFYNRAHNLTSLTSSMPTGVLQSVTFPTLVKMNGDDNVLREGYRRILRISAFIIFPLCLGMGAVAYPLVNTLYTTKWIYAASLLQIMVFSMMWYPIHAINLNLLMVKGRSDLFFRLEVIKKILGVTMMCITVPFGIVAMCIGSVLNSIIALAINTHYTGKLLNLGFLTQLKDYWPSLLISLLMFVFVTSLAHVMGNDIISLITCIATGIVVYLGSAILFKRPELKELKNIRK